MCVCVYVYVSVCVCVCVCVKTKFLNCNKKILDYLITNSTQIKIINFKYLDSTDNIKNNIVKKI